MPYDCIYDCKVTHGKKQTNVSVCSRLSNPHDCGSILNTRAALYKAFTYYMYCNAQLRMNIRSIFFFKKVTPKKIK